MRKKIELLKHHTGFAPHRINGLEVVAKRHAVNDEPALLVRLQPVDAADECRLTRSRRPADDDAFTARDIKIDIAQHMKLPEPLVEFSDFDDWFTHGPPSPFPGGVR